MTYRRLKAALERIADGDEDPVAIAKEALRLRQRGPIAKPPPPPRTRIEDIRAARAQQDAALLERFVEAGCPSFAAFARALDWKVHRVKRRLFAGMRGVRDNRVAVDEQFRKAADDLWQQWQRDLERYSRTPFQKLARRGP